MKAPKKEETINVSFSQKGIRNQHYQRVPFERIVNEIQNPSDHNLDLINKIRDFSDQIKVEKNDQIRSGLEKKKRELKCILAHFSPAEFKDNYRSNDNFISSQLMIIDIDKCEDVQSLKEKLKKDNRVFILFISPSGDGLKVIYWFDKPITNADVFKAISEKIAEEFSKEYEVEVDKIFDAARACFISYDTDLWINNNCEKLTVDIDSLNIKNPTNEFKTKDESFINNWNGVKEGQRKNGLVKHIGECIQKGIQVDVASLILMEWNKKNSPPLEKEEIIDTVEDVYNRYNDAITKFLWYDEKNRLVFSDRQFKFFLEGLGYYKFPLSTGYTLIKQEEKIVDMVEDHQLKEDLLGFISDPKKQDYLIHYTNMIIAKGKKDYLRSVDFEFNEDTKDTGFVYFKNGYVAITKDGISDLLPYSTLTKAIWKSKIIERQLTLNQEENYIFKSEFCRLLQNITGGREDRFYALVTAVGYLSHSYYDPSERKAVVLYDETDPEMEGLAEGGKGKSIIGQGLRHFKMNNAWIDGSTLEKIEKHTFQSVNPDTELLIVDDLVKKFKFGKMFACITEGVTVEKKYKDPFIVKNIKFFITSNFTLGGEGSSYDRRLTEIEIAPHYNLDFTPIDEFKHILFEEWDEEQWNMYYNFMLWCEKTYLERGLVEYQKVYLADKKIIENTNIAFYKFVESYIEIGKTYFKHDILKDFKEYSGFDNFTMWKLTRWLNTYARHKDLILEPESGPGNRDNKFTLVKIKKLKPSS